MDYLIDSKVQFDEYLFYSTTPELACSFNQLENVNYRFIMNLFYITILVMNILVINKNFGVTSNTFEHDFSILFFLIFFYFITGGLLTL